MFFSLWARFAGRPAASAAPVRCRPSVESLEDRVVPDAAATNQAFVTAVYQDVLNRAPDAGGLAAWTNALNTGALTPFQVAFQIETSPEHLTDIVQADYQQFLHRAADAGGLAFFVNFLERGGTDQQVQAMILGSDEYFMNRGGGTNSGWLTAVYQDLLNRAPDPGGLAAWTNALNAGFSRTQVALVIATSPEANTIEVQNLYNQLLGRAADPGGLAFFTTQLQISNAAHNNGNASASASATANLGNANASQQANVGNTNASQQANLGNANASATGSAAPGLTNEQAAAVIISSPEFFSRLTT